MKMFHLSVAALVAALNSACASLVPVRVIPSFAPSVQAEPNISAKYSFESKYVNVMGSRMHYVEVGEGPPVVFVHGNPTSSYLWRNVLPIVAKHHRAIALDMIGMGKSDKPDIPYKLDDFIRYFDGFMAAMNLPDVILVVHDWGGGVGIDYAVRHQDQVRGLVMMEAVIRPTHWDEVDPYTEKVFRALGIPRTGSSSR